MSETTPAYYRRGKIQAIEVIEDWGLSFHLGNVVKYVARAGLKDECPLSDLKKALWYLQRTVTQEEIREEYRARVRAMNERIAESRAIAEKQKTEEDHNDRKENDRAKGSGTTAQRKNQKRRDGQSR